MFEDPRMNKSMTYLGDGVYAHYDGIDLELSVSDGKDITQKIILEPVVLYSLIRFAIKTGLYRPAP
jgi:hypothetical protein